MDRATVVHEQFLEKVSKGDFPRGAPAREDVAPETMVAMFRGQCMSRQLDRTSRAMQKAGQGYYTIGSSGHEGMAAVADADPHAPLPRRVAHQKARHGHARGV